MLIWHRRDFAYLLERNCTLAILCSCSNDRLDRLDRRNDPSRRLKSKFVVLNAENG
ncbi:uncharacterized protein MYCFIDRAFT_179484 [Pseudocercospora fijiensis CIRAD86]|uniref:Uncharacterized protein n=1 Tax=Pseudocercospora fijiensis (strain CIRAD86) TaxID=383855 RepID=M2ZFV5_PSEFD|nr:uncharacterized protein MYCFIDRAFT_179484 [Pseudocercospora fijiensis CIRAD86]EME78034.1 hypothetical protein MYCFIDRAFT_179484 [Pseudocercospora fijiensis CIRAD86]